MDTVSCVARRKARKGARDPTTRTTSSTTFFRLDAEVEERKPSLASALHVVEIAERRYYPPRVGVTAGSNRALEARSSKPDVSSRYSASQIGSVVAARYKSIL